MKKKKQLKTGIWNSKEKKNPRSFFSINPLLEFVLHALLRSKKCWIMKTNTHPEVDDLYREAEDSLPPKIKY